MDNELVCNFRKCRKRLNGIAWVCIHNYHPQMKCGKVTSCSHIFCDEDAKREYNKKATCPACETPLTGRYDFFKVDLQPTEQCKSMWLAGQKPDVIMETCSRALAFWTYQAHQERVYQEYIATKAKERNAQLETYYEGTVGRLEAEINCPRVQYFVILLPPANEVCEALKAELEGTRRKYSEVSEKLTEKNRQYQKLQGLYDGLRRKCITPQSFESEREGLLHITPRFIQPHHDFRPVVSQDDMMLSQKNHLLQVGGDHRVELERGHFNKPSPRNSPPQKESAKEFVLRPNVTPIPPAFSVIQDRDRFNLGLGPQAPAQSAYKKH